MQLGIELLQALQINVREPLGSKFARLDPARKLRHGGERNVFVARRQRDRDRHGCAQSGRARVRSSAPAVRDSSATPAQASIRAPPCADRCAARKVRPSSCANCRRPRSRSPAFISNCTNFSASTKVVVDTSGPTAGPVPNAGGAPRRQICWILSRWILRVRAQRGHSSKRCQRCFNQKLSARFRHESSARHCSCWRGGRSRVGGSTTETGRPVVLHGGRRFPEATGKSRRVVRWHVSGIPPEVS